MIRKLLFILTVATGTLVVGSLVILVGRLFGGEPARRLEAIWGRLVCLAAGVRLQTEFDALDASEPYVFMVNHQSNLDIPVLSAALSSWNLVFVAKKELFDVPFFGYVLRRRGHVRIDRSNPRQSMRAIKEATELAQAGTSIVIFPEGTRNTDMERLREFQVGGMVLALKSSVRVAPLVMHGTGHILSRHGRSLTPGPVHIRALPPFDPAEHYELKERERMKSDLYATMNEAYVGLAKQQDLRDG